MNKLIIALTLLSLVLVVGCDTCRTSYKIHNVEGEVIAICEARDCSWNNCEYWDCDIYDSIEDGSYLIKEVAGTC